MPQPTEKIPKTKLTVNRIVLIYFVVGSTWIIFSSLWLSQQASDSEIILTIEALKGLSYILVTTVLLWVLSRSWARQVDEALSKYEQSEHKLLMLNSLLRAVRRINKAIVNTPEVNPLIRKICEILVEDREFKHAWIALLGEDGKPLHYYDAPKLKDADKLKYFLEAGKLPHCFESTKREEGLILATRPIEQCPDFPVMEGLEDCALLGIEFSYDNSLGYIVLMASQTAINDEEEIDLFREVAQDLRFALQSIKAETERSRVAEDLIIAKKAAEKANRAKGEFLSVMSHELRTPLNPIMGHTSLLMEESVDPEYIRSLEEIYCSSEKLLALINNILLFSQLEKGSKANPSTQFYLFECCEAALEKCRQDCPEQQIYFENGTADHQAISPDTLVASDIEHIKYIIGELLNNACKYTHKGDIHFRAGQRALGSDKLEVLFEIEDSGIGVEKEILEKLFHPFTQLDSSNTRRYRGIGMGLAICRKIANVMGGSLTAESQPGEGSCFRFRCTLEKAEPQEIPVRKTPQEEAPGSSSKGRILLVEDNPSNALVARRILERMGLEADLAEHGQLAVEMCQDKRYELILMDLSMPVMNGFDATREIQNSNTLNQKTPIIALTAHVSSDVEADCYSAGMAGFVSKPIRRKIFKECISKYIPIA